MPIDFFESSKEIGDLANKLTLLLSSWGLSIDDWMMGKNISLYIHKIYPDAKSISREVTVHVLKSKLPWKVKNSIRSVVPPARTRFDKEYQALQKQLNVGVDFWPVPDGNLTKKDILGAPKINIDNTIIRVESIGQYVNLRLKISKFFLQKPADEIREFYYANQARYELRLNDYRHIASWARKNDSSVTSLIDELTRIYRILIKKAYPEIFTKVGKDIKEIEGKVIYKNKDSVSGEVIHFREDRDLENKIVVFSHFRPIDSRFVKKAKAVITDGGGLLSHVAIICREYNIPCIIDTKYASKVLKDKDRVKINFKNGNIKIKQ